MTESSFFRLLDVGVDSKGGALQAQIAALNEESHPPKSAHPEEIGQRFVVDCNQFDKIPKSRLAYWSSDTILDLFDDLPRFEPSAGEVRTGLQSLGANELFVRAWWEVNASLLGKTERWAYFAKGGESAAWHSDIHLVTEWENEGERQKRFAAKKYRSITRKIVGMDYYFLPGLTYTCYTNKGFSARVMPGDCIFSLAGPAIFSNQPRDVYWILAVLNSSLVEFLLRLMTDGRKWEPGYVKSLPIKRPDPKLAQRLEALAIESYNLQRAFAQTDETTHAFAVPGLVYRREAETLGEAQERLAADIRAANALVLEDLTAIDKLVFELYAMNETDRGIVCQQIGDAPVVEHDVDLITRVENLLMWCVGVAFGRWDVRKALDPSRLPPLGGPFDPLPRCAPGALVGDDGLPLSEKDLPDDYPLPIAWDGIVVDDPDHPSDIVGRVQGVLDLLWGDRAGAIEREICEIVGVDRLRDYFRDRRNGFFAFHAKRYSKSRRKAPIYWLLQSEDRHYAVWLYYHRLDTAMLYAAGRGYADAKVELEQGRLQTLQQGADALEGSARRRRYREIERQRAIVADVTAFRDELDRLALLDLAFDLNDGVLLNIAPLHELVPWKYAERTWKRSQEGKYGWSSMARQLRQRGLVQSPTKD